MSKAKTMQYSDPALEEFSEDIRKMVMEDSNGLLDSEIESIIRLVSNTATLVTSIIPLAGRSNRCSNKLLMKTLHVTLVDHRTRTTIIKENGKLYPNTGDRTRYLVIPQDGILSKSAELFNQEIHVVGRTCWADHTINVTAGTTSNPLLQTFTIQTPKNITMVEYCPSNKTWISRKWTVTTFTLLELPITCKIESSKFNCSAMSLTKSESKDVQFPHHRMKILEQHWDEEASNLNGTKFYRSNTTVELTSSSFPSLPSPTNYSNLMIPLIFVGGTIAFTIMVSIAIKLTVCRNSGNPTGAINLHIDNSSNNENKTSSSATNEVEDAAPIPEPAQEEKTIEEILDMRPGARSAEERRRVTEYRYAQKEQEASGQQSEPSEPAKIWKLLAKDASLLTPSEQLTLDEWNKTQDPFEA
jgi:hypothetical protein